MDAFLSTSIDLKKNNVNKSYQNEYKIYLLIIES